MSNKQIIHTPDAPAAIGTYSQAVKVANTSVSLGQIGLDPNTMQMVEGIEAQVQSRDFRICALSPPLRVAAWTTW